MTIGKNMNLKDKLIKDTTSITNITSNKNKIPKPKKASKASNKSKTSIKKKTNNKNITNNTNITSKTSKDTANTIKMTFYIKTDLLSNIYNYSYWDRLSLTRAFNKVVKDGLKGKDTRQRKAQ